MPYPLTADQVETFQRAGVLYLPGIVSAHEVARLREACDRVMARPTALGAELTPSGSRGRFFGDLATFRADTGYFFADEAHSVSGESWSVL